MTTLTLTEFNAGTATQNKIRRSDFLTTFTEVEDALNALEAGTDISTLNAGENLPERSFVYLNPSDTKWYLIDTNASPPACGSIRGVVNEIGGIASAAAGSVRRDGLVDGFTGLTPGGLMYASTTAGSYTQTRPTVSAGGGQVALVVMGIAISTTQMLVLTKRAVEYLKRESLADTDTLTIEHHSDEDARVRQVLARVSLAIGSSVESYGSANQDWDVRLQASGAGATENSGAQSGTSAGIGDAGGTEYWLAQSFTVTGGRLSQITFTLGANTGTPAGDLVWGIYDNVSGHPGTALKSGTIPNASVVPSAQNTVNIDNGPLLVGATTYWLVLHSSINESTNNRWNWTSKNPGTYANGALAASTNGGSTWDTATYAAWDTTFTVTTSAEGKSKLAQSFQVSGATDVFSIKLWLKKSGSPTGNLTVKIQGDSAGAPNGTPITNGISDTVAASTLSTSYGWIEFTFATAPSLTGSTTYWMVLETSDSASASNYVLWGADGSSPGYASGSMSNYIASWTAESKDASFDILEPGTAYEEPCAMRRWSSSSTEFDVASRFDDGAGASLDTNTTFMNVSGSSLDVTCIVVLE